MKFSKLYEGYRHGGYNNKSKNNNNRRQNRSQELNQSLNQTFEVNMKLNYSNILNFKKVYHIHYIIFFFFR